MHPQLIELDAADLFGRALRLARWRLLRAGLAGRGRALPELSALTGPTAARRGRPRLARVPLASVVGSYGRRGDFDVDLLPLSRRSSGRWRRVAAAMIAGAPLPPVRLAEIGGRYYVLDGMHRASAAAALGHDEIDALVEPWGA